MDPNCPFHAQSEEWLKGKLLFLVRVSSPTRIHIYRRLVHMGARLVFIHPMKRDPFNEVAHDWILTDTHDVDAMIAVVQAEMVKRDLNPDAVFTFDEYGVFPSSRLNEALGRQPLPMPPAAVQTTMIKSRFREWSLENGVESPGFVVVKGIDEIEANREAISKLKFPVVAKPSPGAGSNYAKKCDNAGDVCDFVREVFEKINSHQDVPHWAVLGVKPHMLVEEFIYGQEVDIDCAVADGKILFAGVSDNFPVLAPYFSETGGVAPSRLPAHSQQTLLKLLEVWVKAQGSSLRGVLHFEAKYDEVKDKAVCVEVNCRLGGAETRCMVQTAWGLDLGIVAALLALGHSPDLSQFRTTRAYAASVNTYPHTTGILREDPFPASVTQDKHYVDHQLFAEVGALVKAPPEAFGCIAWMVAQGDSHEEAIEKVDYLTTALEFSVGSFFARPQEEHISITEPAKRVECPVGATVATSFRFASFCVQCGVVKPTSNDGISLAGIDGASRVCAH